MQSLPPDWRAGGATAPLEPSLSDILNIMLHCPKFLEKPQLIVVVKKLQLIGKIISLAPQKSSSNCAPVGEQGKYKIG